ncbi:MAG: bacteriohemerythrin [Sulfuritalea sp.]|nr:bacteriohemerythrin [Sulfuritalea sp.]
MDDREVLDAGVKGFPDPVSAEASISVAVSADAFGKSGEIPVTGDELASVLQAIDQGYLWLDEGLVVRGHNQAYRTLLGLDDRGQLIGRPYGEVLKLLLERSEFFDSGDHATFIAERLQTMQRLGKRRFERVRPNGTVLSVASMPLSTGGYVYTYLDITRESRALEDVRRNAKAMVVAMANFSEHRDTDTGIHVLRVARLVGQTARQLQRRGLFPGIIDEAFIEHVSTASMLHDVGKISTPDRILLKAGPMTKDERANIELHATTGAHILNQASRMISDSHYLHVGAEIALTHHEWFDGSGYPNGLAGEDIPLAGRICALADVFDALTSRRPYKGPWSTRQAMMQIRQQAGSQFDPVVAEAFLEVIREREKVSLVQWSTSMSSGNLHIDEQHAILIDTINQLASAESQDDRPVVAMIIDELVNYTVFHFDYEERLIEATGYPELENHRRIHQGFVKWVRELREEFTYHRRRQLGERILGFLCDWLREHILGEDLRYRPYIGGVE